MNKEDQRERKGRLHVYEDVEAEMRLADEPLLLTKFLQTVFGYRARLISPN
jgi:hypothetical protein